MVNFLMVSNLLLWVCVIFLVLTIFALLRQVGVLCERVAPAGALMLNKKLKVGEQAAEFSVTDLETNRQLQLGGQRSDGRSQLLFFLDSKCPVCKTLLPVLESSALAERSWLDIVLIGDADAETQKNFIREYSLQNFEFVNSVLVGKAYGISKLPSAVLIDSAGKIASLGLINSREHLESLFEAKERGVSSIQEYIGHQMQSSAQGNNNELV